MELVELGKGEVIKTTYGAQLEFAKQVYDKKMLLRLFTLLRRKEQQNPEILGDFINGFESSLAFMKASLQKQIEDANPDDDITDIALRYALLVRVEKHVDSE